MLSDMPPGGGLLSIENTRVCPAATVKSVHTTLLSPLGLYTEYSGGPRGGVPPGCICSHSWEDWPGTSRVAKVLTPLSAALAVPVSRMVPAAVGDAPCRSWKVNE